MKLKINSIIIIISYFKFSYSNLDSETSAKLKELYEYEFKQFKLDFNKTYNYTFNEEAKSNYLLSKLEISKSNRKYIQHDHIYHYTDLNKYSDMTYEQFNKAFNGYKNELRTSNEISKAHLIQYNDLQKYNIPERMDWRIFDFVTNVKDQNRCAADYAYATVDAIEIYYFLKTQTKLNLSVQNVIDCSKDFGNDGCNGGFTRSALNYIIENNGIATENNYQFRSDKETCQKNQYNIPINIHGYVQIPEGNEEILKEIVALHGPVLAAINANLEDFKHYKDDVYYNTNCNDHSLNHVVLIVGYDTDSKYMDYWIIKNSYGHTWGNGGFMKLARNVENMCGIATDALYLKI